METAGFEGRREIRRGKKVQKKKKYGFAWSIKKPLDSKVVNISNEGKPRDWAGLAQGGGHTPSCTSKGNKHERRGGVLFERVWSRRIL
jgi:hypothetical protein